jgi:NhaP-type Na+/H+ or K+/H+ antiporter
MNTVMSVLMGLIVGYVIGIVIAALFAFVLDFDSVARFIAIGFGLLGAVAGPRVFGRLIDQPR